MMYTILHICSCQRRSCRDSTGAADIYLVDQSLVLILDLLLIETVDMLLVAVSLVVCKSVGLVREANSTIVDGEAANL